MENFESAANEEEVIMSRYLDIEWMDEVNELRCKRCQVVLVQHYIADCQHAFCSNCKRVLGDGSGRWRCPLCHHLIRNIERQDFELRRKVFDLRVHCPNRKYGCQHACALKELKEHLEKCNDTRERALPVLYKGGQLSESEKEVFELRAEMKEMKEKMKEMETRHKDELEQSLKVIEIKVDRVQEETTRLSFEIKTKSPIDEKETDITKVELKMDLWIELLEKNSKNLQAMEIHLENEVRNLKIQIENEVGFKMKMQELIENVKTDMVKNSTDVVKKFETMETEVENVVQKIGTLETKVEDIANEKIVKMERGQRLLDMRLNAQEFKAREMIEEKVSESNARLTLVEVEMDQIKTLKCSNEVNMEQRMFRLEHLYSLRFPQISSFDLVYKNLYFQPDYTWKINGENKSTFMRRKSKVFSCTGYPFTAQAEFYLSSYANVYFWLNFKDENTGKLKDINIMPNYYFVFRDQSGNSDAKHMCTNGRTVSELSWYNRRLTSPIYTTFFDDKYNVNGSVMIDIYVEGPTMAQQVHSFDGTLNWMIDSYSKRVKVEKEGLVLEYESPYFYTAPNGYRIQVLMYLNGWGEFENKGLTAMVVFTKGEFSATLPQSFDQQTTVTLFDRKHQRHVVKKEDSNIYKYKNYCLINVCDKDELANYIENDAIFYKVTVTTSAVQK